MDEFVHRPFKCSDQYAEFFSFFFKSVLQMFFLSTKFRNINLESKVLGVKIVRPFEEIKQNENIIIIRLLK